MPGIAAAGIPSYRDAPAKAMRSVKQTKRDEDPREDDPENTYPNTILRIPAGRQKSCLWEEQVKVRAQPMCFEAVASMHTIRIPRRSSFEVTTTTNTWCLNTACLCARGL